MTRVEIIMVTIAYIALGSNVSPLSNIVDAVAMIQRVARVSGASTFYRTAPFGPPGQPEFRNGVIRVETVASATDLKFGILRVIESRLGRVRSDDRYAPRPIDLDILIFGNDVIHENGLTIPDPDLRERPFLAVPLLELDSLLILPDSGEPLSGLASVRSATPMAADATLTRLVKEKLGLWTRPE